MVPQFKILVVDDEVDILNILEMYLSNIEIQVFLAISPIEADQILSVEKIDIIICDHFFQGSYGVNWLKELRAKGSLEFFILFTGCFETLKGDYTDIGNIKSIIKTDFSLLKSTVCEFLKRFQRTY